ncbi:MAG TPA: transcriptional activator RfaH [Candidatus Acidoferrales bacterium]|nr:transcriptional activator RfaH [Candidatus Acidoferrales bacterium]
MEDQVQNPAWYCARTKPKHEHIAAATLRKNLGLEAFLPRLRVERATRRGAVRTIEALFPCYLFVRCVIDEKLDEIRHTNGVSSLVRFGGKVSIVEDSIIEELQDCFEADEPMTVEHRLTPGSEVSVTGGAFDGMRAHVLRNMPARQRVQILLDILGQPTPVEVDRSAVILLESTVAHLAPVLARETTRV